MKKNKALICILCISFVQMATNGISAILGDIQNYYAGVPTSIVQLLMTFPSLFIVIFTLLSAYLLNYFSAKRLIMIGLCFVCLSGIISFVGYRSLLILFVGAGLLGIGSGLCGALAISLISVYFDESERPKIMGYQTAASNFGSMMMTFFGGLLATISWHYNYLVYFVALFGLLSTCLFMDDKKRHDQKKLDIRACHYSLKMGLLIILFMVFFYIGPTSIALALQEKGYSESSIAGMGATLFLLGGVILSLLYGKIENKLHDQVFALGFLVLAIGLFIMHGASQLWSFYLGCLVAGSSISLVMPRCMFNISIHERQENVAMGTAIGMASSNVGTLIAPGFTILCGSMTTTSRLFVATIICIIISLIMKRKVNKNER